MYSGIDRGDTYSSLVFDNRGTVHSYLTSPTSIFLLLTYTQGVGNSDKPLLLRYTTTEMARDLLEVLEHVGWAGEERRIHLVGASMGGEYLLYLKSLVISDWLVD